MIAKKVFLSVFVGILILGLLAVSPQASAGIEGIGVSFGDPTRTSGTIDDQDIAGFTGYEQSNWNVAEGASGTVENLLDSAGSETATSLTFSADGQWGRGDVPETPDGYLMSGWLDGKGTDLTIIEFSNVSYSTYDIVLYSHGPGDHFRTREVTLVDASDDSVIAGPYYFRDPEDAAGDMFFDGTFTQADLYTDDDDDVPVGNVWIFEGLTSPNIRVEVGYGQQKVVNDRYPINAVQLVVPEPATLALLGIGSIGLLRRRRK